MEVNKTEVIEFVKSLETDGVIKSGSHKSEAVINTVTQIVSMTEEEHDNFQKESPSQSVLMFFSEFQDWKETR